MNQTSEFAPSGFFVFRTPLLPFDELLRWGEGLEAPAALEDHAQLEQAFARDRVRLRTRLYDIVKRPELREAIFVASPELDRFVDLWASEPDTKRGQNTERALVRYFARMTARPTPFGLFAGVSTATLGQETRLLTEGRPQYRRHTRLDTDYLFALVDAVARDQFLQHAFVYRPNSSLYRVSGRVRYVESRLDDKVRSYHLVAVEETDHLNATLARAGEGASLAALIEALVSEEISAEEATGYVKELIESQILMPDIALPITGPEAIHPLVNQLREVAETAELSKPLNQTRAELEAIDEAGLGIDPQRYCAIAETLEKLPAKVELARLFQVDMVKPAPDATLGHTVTDEIARGVEILHGLATRPRQQSALDRFREAFTARYEQREIPLLEALDEESGIGFGAGSDSEPLLNDITFPPEDEDVTTESKRHNFLLRKLCEALAAGAHEIKLDAPELEALKSKDLLPLPDAFAATATLVSPSPEALTKGDFRVLLKGVTGPSGAVLLGRFCHADETLCAHVSGHLRAEESHRSDAVFAEIVHLAQGRLGNILARPVLREYEIPYLGCSGAQPDRQIPVTDLLVSVRGERVRLHSARMGCEVIPRLTNAHNYSHGSLGVYRFLCILQQQGIAGGLSWRWGALSNAPFLPRVTVGRLVLSQACWHVSKEELHELGETKGAARFRAVQAWRALRRLPRLVMLSDGDNVLPVDFDNALSVESFVHLVREREDARLVEMFPGPEELCARGPEGLFTHELVVPFVKSKDEVGRIKDDSKTQIETKSLHPSSFILPPCSRRFPPGSEWLYSKLYTGTATADHVLREVVRPVVDEVMRSGAADRWFFIRFSDPDWHLRLRFHGEPDELHAKVLPAIQSAVAPLIEDGRLWRVQLDTYEREVERYGGAEGIILAERIFHVDSEAALEIIEMLEPGDVGAEERWHLALRGIDALLTDFGFNLETKRDVLKRLREAYGKEFRADDNVRGQLSEKYRKERKSIESLLEPDYDEEHPLAPGFAILRRRSEQLAPVIVELKSLEQAGQLSVSLKELAPSYMHMHTFRVLRSAQRAQELVLYDFLARVYDSHAARKKRL